MTTRDHTSQAAVRVSDYALYYVRALGRSWRSAIQRGDFDAEFKFPPAGEGGAIPLKPSAWRVYVGGVLVNITAPDFAKGKLGDLPVPPPGMSRAVLLFVDNDVARRAAQLDGAYRRRFAWLIEGSDGVWSIRMRWSVPRQDNRGKPRVKRKHVRRWKIAPPEWPRDKWGRTLSTYAATRKLGRDAVQRLLGYPDA